MADYEVVALVCIVLYCIVVVVVVVGPFVDVVVELLFLFLFCERS